MVSFQDPRLGFLPRTSPGKLSFLSLLLVTIQEGFRLRQLLLEIFFLSIDFDFQSSGSPSFYSEGYQAIWK